MLLCVPALRAHDAHTFTIAGCIQKSHESNEQVCIYVPLHAPTCVLTATLRLDVFRRGRIPRLTASYARLQTFRCKRSHEEKRKTICTIDDIHELVSFPPVRPGGTTCRREPVVHDRILLCFPSCHYLRHHEHPGECHCGADVGSFTSEQAAFACPRGEGPACRARQYQGDFLDFRHRREQQPGPR